MINRDAVIREIYDKKIIAIFRGIAPGQCAAAAKALYEGGITMMEVTFDPEEKDTQYQSTVDGIRSIVQAEGEKVFVGAGTVIHTDQVVLAYNAGAQYIIMPTLDEEIIRLAHELGMVTMPGAFTATEINNAYNAGADFVKVFPASEAGISYFKAIRGPLRHIPLMAVGGVDKKNGKDFLRAGAVGLGIGGNLVDRKLIDSGDYEGLTELARQYVASIQ